MSGALDLLDSCNKQIITSLIYHKIEVSIWYVMHHIYCDFKIQYQKLHQEQPKLSIVEIGNNWLNVWISYEVKCRIVSIIYSPSLCMKDHLLITQSNYILR